MFSEVGLGGGFDSVGGSSIGDLIEVHFQDFIFGVHEFSCEGEEEFFEFSFKGSFLGE